MVSYQSIIFNFLGGLGLFLFSIKYMGDGLKLIAGDRIRYLLDKYTTNPFLGVLTGIVVTALLQSSSGVTVIVVGMVSIGLLNLRQAIGIIMGANIGTTVTAFIIGISISKYSLPIMFIGAALLFFSSNPRVNNIGRTIFGFGGLFFALSLMSSATAPLRNLEEVRNFLINVGNHPVQGVFLGTLLTVVIQSSSATIGILQNIYTDGLIPLKGALPILFGDNIGTTITAVLSVLAANTAAKRVAVSHVIFNLVGTIIFMIFLSPFMYLINKLSSILALNPKLEIALAHGIFNITNTILMFPFIGVFVYIVVKLIPSKKDEDEKQEKYLDKAYIEKSATLALAQSNKEMLYMYKLSRKNFLASFEFFNTRDIKMNTKIEKRETLINQIDNELTHYLSDISSIRLSQKESEILTSYIDITRDIERIADHANNFSKEIIYQIENNLKISDNAKHELNNIKEVILELIDLTHDNLVNTGEKNMSEMYRLCEQIYEKERESRTNYINRFINQELDVKAGLQYVDILNHLTRVCDHLKNINEKIVG